MNPSISALLLAGLLTMPLVALWLTRVRGALNASGNRRQAALHSAYVLTTIAVGAWLIRELAVAPIDSSHGRVAMAMMAAATMCLLAAPIYPLSGPIVYVVLSYAFPREHPVTNALMAVGAMSWITVLSVPAAALWSFRRLGTIGMPQGRLISVASAFSAWLAVAVIAAVVAGRPLEPDLTVRAERYVHAMALFLVAAACRPGLRDVRILAMVLSAALVVRQAWLTESWFNEQNLAMLTAITTPLVLAVAFCRPLSALQIPLAAGAAYMTSMVVFVQNRGALLGLGASLLGLWTLGRSRRRWFVVLAILSTSVIVWAARAGLLNRFLEIYAGGRFLGTAAERLDIWSGGLRLAVDHWLFGVGPGNFVHFLAPYMADGKVNRPHNSLVEVLAEAGLPGLVLYVSIFVAAIREVTAVARRFPADWRRNLAGGLLGTISAYLVTGFFLSNPSLVWIWVVLGVAASLPQSSPLHDQTSESVA